ncbi:DNA methyltransferase [Vibrio ezurae]|uniref:site-specific DNA-methyltransferase (adenine-specific) n=1 Tax=Vibrio ezurae NBRC 102218 TaxID=1219080 RepID=U3B5C2_9VIBR|nr:DNA methyltransferase [Vibrio ezurae]GAD80632.1 hypothetical protein VEZ01S_38_00210 [Vibrio ezurae NBRC 102218]
MAKITYTEVQDNLKTLSENITPQTYAFDFVQAFGIPKATLTKLKKTSPDGREVIHKGGAMVRVVDGDPIDALVRLKNEKSLKTNRIRILMVTNLETAIAFDTKVNETMPTLPLENLHEEFEFFLPLAGMERASLASESVADAKAAEKMAKLFDILKAYNGTSTDEELHAMNVFLARLLFCFFAEDTGIFGKNQFTQLTADVTQKDGSDMHSILAEVFSILDLAPHEPGRDNHSNLIKSLPYVNGGLFAESLPVPKFNLRARSALIECGALDWSKINPDIFGSMIQAVVDVKQRANMGMHYTSVENIMKVISPLFLEKLHDAHQKVLESGFNAARKVTELKALCSRLSKIKIGDMACGSGNFLIIAYRELRLLEMEILKSIRELEGNSNQMALGFGSPQCGISVGQFYGIELDEFCCQIAELSLWLVEHQMNQQFNEEFGSSEAVLPLKSYNNLHAGNALRIDWNSVMPNEGEVYIVGNPPFLGSSMQSKEQKEDMKHILSKLPKYKKLDFVTCWFYLAGQYIRNTSAEFALVSTNSICQGSQTGSLWPSILQNNIEISFAHTSFKWTNNAKNKAAVICVIVGLRTLSSEDKLLITENIVSVVKNISPYLANSESIIVDGSWKALNSFPMIEYGNKPTDGGNLILNDDERNEIFNNEPFAKRFLREYIGSAELINGKRRWCLWLHETDLEQLEKNIVIKARLDKVRKMRLDSTKAATRDFAKEPNKFEFASYSSKRGTGLFIPRVSSETRNYIPMDFRGNDTVASDSNFVVYDAPRYLLALLSNKMHTLWVATVGGRLKTDYRYSNTLCYNTFPVPDLANSDIDKLEAFANQIIRERIMSGDTLATLCVRSKMPASLLKVHSELDAFMDSLYQKASGRSKPLETDADRLEVLFKLYTEMKAKAGK